MASNQNEDLGLEEDDIAQGGLPLQSVPERPHSTLNPATAAWIPGGITAEQLNATRNGIPAAGVTGGEAYFQLLQAADSPQAPHGHANQVANDLSVANFSHIEAAPPNAQFPNNFVHYGGSVAPGGFIGSNIGIASDQMAANATQGGGFAYSPGLLPGNPLQGSGLVAPGGFTGSNYGIHATQTMVNPAQSGGTFPVQGQASVSFGPGGATLVSGPQPLGSGGFNPSGALNIATNLIQGNTRIDHPASFMHGSQITPGNAHQIGLTHQTNNGFMGSGSATQAVTGSANKLSGMPLLLNALSGGLSNCPSSFVPVADNNSSFSASSRGHDSVNTFTNIQGGTNMSHGAPEPPGYELSIPTSNLTLGRALPAQQSLPNVRAQPAHAPQFDPLATPTPIRAVPTPHGQDYVGSPSSARLTATPGIVVQQHASPLRSPDSGRGLMAGDSPASADTNGLVMYASSALAEHVHTHGLIVKKPMKCPPSSNPQIISFEGQIHILNLPPLPAATAEYSTFGQRSQQLKNLTVGGTGYPSIKMALDPDFFPFEPLNAGCKRPDYGVIRIKNIPFNAKRSEIIALFGKNAKLLNDVDEPVHIIMDRASSKTNDAYVEFMTMEDATRAVERFNHLHENEKPPRLGERNVQMQLSGQAALMHELFPLAKNVIWDGCNPLIQAPRYGRTFNNFRGFVSEEEMLMMIKHVDTPHRSPYSKDCPQRPYECLISTLKKFPWHCTEGLTVGQRHAIFNSTINLIRRLTASVSRNKDYLDLTQGLLHRLIDTAMFCPGFSMVQKDSIAFEIKMTDVQARAFSVPRFAAAWRHLYGIRPKAGVPIDLIEWYISVIREETVRIRDKLPPSLRNRIRSATADETDSYFGDLWVELWRPFGHEFDIETISHASDRELMCIERILRRALSA